ncbi:MAG TPA: TIGR00730 family Rossman fold protein [Hanamia sp.]|nr:TIGR00730 family Rossman fold protein [Hanamia sp.]
MSIKSLTVFCGSKNGSDPLFVEHAKQIGYLLAKNKVTLIYGGGNKGIMGAVANAVLENNGKVIGIMPRFLAVPEHQHNGVTEMIEVEDMHVRKRLLYEKCDAALVLPGGFGTMDEFFEMLTWNQLDIHNKKIFVLNTSGFYNHLVTFLNKTEEDGFLYSDIQQYLQVISIPGDLEAFLIADEVSVKNKQ